MAECPLRGRDPLPSCEGLDRVEVGQHIDKTHLAGTQWKLTSYTAMIEFRSKALRVASEVLTDEGLRGAGLDAHLKAEEFEMLTRALKQVARDEALGPERQEQPGEWSSVDRIRGQR